MKLLMCLAVVILMTSCSSTKVEKIGDKIYSRLPENEPVQVFAAHYPDLVYEEICKIDLVRNTEFSLKTSADDYYDELKVEARKCGANGVVVNYSSRYGKNISIYATGIKILSEESKIKSDDIKKLSLATQTSNISAMEKMLSNVTKNRSKRAPSDTKIIDGLLYIYARKGFGCDVKMVELFKNYEAIIPNFNYIKIFQDGLYDENIIYCKNILLHSFPQIKEKGKFAIELNNHFLNFLNHLSTRGKHISQKLSAYEMLFKLVISVIKEECAKDETSELCILKSSFNKHEKSLVKRHENV